MKNKGIFIVAETFFGSIESKIHYSGDDEERAIHTFKILTERTHNQITLIRGFDTDRFK